MAFYSPAAPRLKRPSWRDPRLLIGILLVLVSVAAVVVLVGGADKTVDVYAAKSDIAVGHTINQELLERVKVRLDEVQDHYFLASDIFPGNAVAARRIPHGDLVAKSSVDQPQALARNPVAPTLEEKLPIGAKVGSRVDVWVSLPDAKTGGFVEPRLLLPGVEISQLDSESNGLGSARTTTVYVLAGKPQLPQILGALASKAKVSVVWNPAGSGR
ncbi:conserved hypothetical protein [Renibacterium salmoninarum ATCC 33209]|uniref:SAF domain-containing protein n=1 Tax=Renibacterium salmoninarum (strain ATCC 33209 / DSM 20767 / JCM 11484 / NBRC 15589 / NCIMB 2235) TaxID=288705 RepID=A9WMN3_RENSM|nr:hypothetical protein [Renibacterium salmoninarum]ABY23361.1 conserved hypothetical protein [Renibacterium salmoninarum ATCC 33209]